jgi:hypothetical protein
VAEVGGALAGAAALGLSIAEAAQLVGNVNAANTARERRKRLRNTRNPRLDPYVDAVLSTGSAPVGPAMYPDGSQLPSIPVKFKQSITITPDSGSIAFTLVPCFDGVVGLRLGTVTTSIPKYAASASSTIASINAVSFAGNGAATYVIPQGQLLKLGDQTADGFCDLHPSSWRMLSVDCEVEYAGPALTASGTVSMCRGSSNYAVSNATGSINGTTVMTYTGDHIPLTTPDMATSAQFTRHAATKAFSILNVNSTPTFQPIWTWNRLVLGQNYGVAAQTSADADLLAGLHGYDPNVPWTAILYEGLDTDASISVNISYMIEVTVSSGTILASIAKPNPPKRAAAERQLQALASSLPVSFPGARMPNSGQNMGLLQHATQLSLSL